MSTIYQVSTKQELDAAIDAAVGGDRIELAPGDYGDVYYTSMHFSSEVVITSADPDDPAVFSQIKVWEGSNFTFDSIAIKLDVDENTLGGEPAFKAEYVSNVTLSNSYLEGGYPINGDPEDTVPGTQGDYGIEGYPIGKAFIVNSGENITFSGNEVTTFYSGTQVSNIDGLYLLDNDISGLRTGSFSGLHVDNVEIIGNHVHGSTPWALGGQGDHGNYVHYYTSPNQDGPSENIVIKDNFFEQSSDTSSALLGIYLDDDNHDIGYKNVLIENNVMNNGDSQGLLMENVDGLTVVNNTFIQSSGEANDAPGINLMDDTSNVFIDNNVLAFIHISPTISDPAGNNIVLGDNIFVQRFDPFAENYVGDLFFNPFAVDSDIEDFWAIPGSPADGYGAYQAQVDTSPQTYVGMLSDQAGQGMDMKTITLSAEALYGPSGQIDLTGANVNWDFGDGQTGEGMTVEHTFETAGHHIVTAKVELANGQEIWLDKTISVFTPEALSISFDNGAVDESDFENALTEHGNVSYEQTDLGMSLRLGSTESRVTVDRSEEILDNPEFSISITFQKDGPDPSAQDGMLVYYSSTAYISTDGDTVSFTGLTSDGGKATFKYSDPSINDGNWHQLTYTFSSEAGEGTLYLDGEEVASKTGLTGIQKTTGGHDLHIGSRFGTSFSGLIDNVEFYRDALTAQEVADMYGDLSGEYVTVPVEVEADPVDPVIDLPVEEETESVPPPSEEATEETVAPPAAEETTEDSAPPPAVEENTEELAPPVPEVEGEEGSDVVAEEPDLADVKGKPNGGPKNILEKFVDMLKGLFGRGHANEESAAVEKVASAEASSEETMLSDVIPIVGELDETLPSGREDEDDEEFDFAA